MDFLGFETHGMGGTVRRHLPLSQASATWQPRPAGFGHRALVLGFQTLAIDRGDVDSTNSEALKVPKVPKDNVTL